MKSKKITFITIFALILGIGIVYVNTERTKCVNVYVDFGHLDNNSKVYKCIPTTSETTALDVLNRARIGIEGTNKYGLQVVCRINNLPSPTKPIGLKGHTSYIEKCIDMPAAFAYWAVIVKRHSAIPDPVSVTAGWKWADKGIAELVVKPGDSLGLVFSENDHVRYPL